VAATRTGGDPFKGNTQDPQDFSGFLRSPVPLPSAGKKKYDSTSFATFLKNSGGVELAEGGAGGDAPRADPLLEGLPGKGLPVAVMYGTEYGFSKEIAVKLCTRLKELGNVIPKLLDMADHPDGYNIASEQSLFVIVSTHGEGVPPAEARDFVDWLVKKAPGVAQLPFSVLALGDRNYEHYCACGKQVDAALEALGGRRCAPRVDIDREDWEAVDSWIEAVLRAIPELGLKEIENPYKALSAANGHAVGTNKKKRYGRANPYVATVSAKRGLCSVQSKDDKDTVMIEFDLGDSGIEYTPGDALGIVPLNDPAKVDGLLKVWGVPGSAPVTIPDWDTTSPGLQTTLRDALVKYFDLRHPKVEIFKDFLQARSCKGDATATVEVHAGSGPKNCQESAAVLPSLAASKDEAEKYLEPRHLVDLFREFGPLPLDTVLPRLKALVPRLYSISSSMRENSTRVQCTIATVRYMSLGEERIGVCSTFCGERLEVGQYAGIYVSKNPDFRLPEDPKTPIVMVGPGTGLAPFRSFLKDRTLSGEVCGEAVLYFGCRRRDQDYLYADLLEAWHREGAVQLFTAFSRETGKKVYVQNRLTESGDLVWSLLEKGAHFYVCGDASNMAGSVEKAMLEIIATKGGKGQEGAKEYLDTMSREGRYQRDVWF